MLREYKTALLSDFVKTAGVADCGLDEVVNRSLSHFQSSRTVSTCCDNTKTALSIDFVKTAGVADCGRDEATNRRELQISENAIQDVLEAINTIEIKRFVEISQHSQVR